MTSADSFIVAVLINHQDPATLAGSLCGFITLTRGTYAWPGYWCECILYGPTDHSVALVASFDATRPEQAVRWVRVALRTLVSALSPEEADSLDAHLGACERCVSSLALTRQSRHVDVSIRLPPPSSFPISAGPSKRRSRPGRR